MRIPFVKMSGAGNDMILVDHRGRFLAGGESELARRACDRRFGVGADGLILLEESDRADFAVRFFNPDGGEYGLCGNGARCVPFFAAELGFPGPVHRFDSASGILRGEVTGEGRARVDLAPVGGIRLGI
jgi:diaminopimelate epimerase